MHGDLYIDGEWISGEGIRLSSTDPGSGEEVYHVNAASKTQVNDAVTAASDALTRWSALPNARRLEILKRYEEGLKSTRTEFSRALSHETGKPLWEAETELDAMIAKLGISIEVLEQRRSAESFPLGDVSAHTRYRPIGVLAVLGPFNLPGHLPNGHIVPALLAGNTIVFKPSELTPGVGMRMVELLVEAGVPKGVVNLVQGDTSVGQPLVENPQIDGVLFTGSYAGGRAIARSLADRPETLLALEMGGNNPLVVDEVGDSEAAIVHTLLSAYITSGQRCTCARRLIVARGEWGDRFIERLAERVRGLRVGLQADDPQPFMGPMISAAAATRLMDAQADLHVRGATPIVPLQSDERSSALLHPGLIDVTSVANPGDEELFGPMLQVIRVDDFDAAIEEANRTSYGLAAALISDDRDRFDRFATEVRAGIINWNRQTTGASGKLPFGGVGRSGNHRPAGAWSADYCSDPVASLEAETLSMPGSLPPGIEGSKR